MRMEHILLAWLIFFCSHNLPAVPTVRFLTCRPNPRKVTPRTEFELFFCAQRADMRDERMYLFLAERTLEWRHSPLTVGNDLRQLRVGQLLD